MSHKLYCYVDESGQDTRGALFVVAAVIAAEDRERVRDLLRFIEHESGKAKRKWTKATRRQRHSYMKRVLQSTLLHGCLFYARFSQTTDYLLCVLHTTARALTISASGQPYQATVLIDGLQKGERPRVGQGPFRGRDFTRLYAEHTKNWLLRWPAQTGGPPPSHSQTSSGS